MTKHLLTVLALLVFAVGCDQAKKAEQEAQNAAQNAKVAEALKTQKRGSITKPDEGSGAEAEKKPEKGEAAEPADDSDATESNEDKDDADSDEKTEKSSKLNAKTVLDEAIAAAKAEDKSLFVHFTSAS